VIDLSELALYQCHVCRHKAIAHVNDPWTAENECEECYCLPDLSRAPPVPTSEETGPLPPEVPWAELTVYDCSSCDDACINWSGSAAAQEGYCWTCHSAICGSVSLPFSPSEGVGAEARIRAGLSRPEGAPERPEGATEATRGKRGLALDRAARAHPRRPKGEGERERSAVSDSRGWL